MHVLIYTIATALFLGFSAAYAETGNMLRVNDKLAETVLANGKILLGTKNTFDFAATLQHDFHAFSSHWKVLGKDGFITPLSEQSIIISSALEILTTPTIVNRARTDTTAILMMVCISLFT